MSKTFTIDIVEPIEDILRRARKAASRHNAYFDGDSESGSFSVKGVEGTYQVEDDTIYITVTDKPFYASWSRVEEEINDFFE